MPLGDVTPIRQQYLEIKRQYPDAIVFFRLGDFYETFDQDAEITSRELDIVLTSRNVAKNTRIPMAGIPHHAVDNYLAKLIDKGYHVAICEQIGSQTINGLVPRKVVRVVTPGTLIETNLLQNDKNNYLVSIVFKENGAGRDGDQAGIAYVDISTGEFCAAELSGADVNLHLRSEITRLNPAEVLMPDNISIDGIPGHITKYPGWHFEISRCRHTLQEHFQVASLDGFGMRGLDQAIRAAGAIYQYVQSNQPEVLRLLSSLVNYTLDDFMVLDAATRRNLELTETIRSGETKGSLLYLLDRTNTPMGHRLIRQWVSKPLLDIHTIIERQDGVNFFLENGLLRDSFQHAIRSLPDLERLTNRIIVGHAQPRELVALRTSLQKLPEIKDTFNDLFTDGQENIIVTILDQIELCSDQLLLLQDSIDDDPPATLHSIGVIRSGYSTELDHVIQASKEARDWLSGFEAVERERTGIKSLKVGYNKVFGYYIEVTHSNTSLVPPDYIRKQTLVNAERYITPEMKEYESLVLNADERIKEIEARVYKEICNLLASGSQDLLQTARSLAYLDVLASLAEVAALNHYVRPKIVADTTLIIKDGRHPVVENFQSGVRFVPNDAVFEPGEIVRIVTGPNMSGKSTFLRQVALIALMAQMGSYVPASSANIGLIDRIFTRIGAQDEIHAGQSTFMVEMIETANILNHATSRSLLILDEIGRGTSTYDGLSIAWAVIEYIHNHPGIRARTIFATHYHELIQLSDILPGVRNYNVAVSESDGQPIFLHKIIPGGTDRSYGIHVAQLAGLPRPVIQRAIEILNQLESSSGKAAVIDPSIAQQLTFFPETNPIIDDLKKLDMNTISPIEALNKLFEWQRKYLDHQEFSNNANSSAEPS